MASAGLFAVAGILGCFKLNKTWLLLGVLVGVIVPYSLIPHKEYRFVFATIPIFLTLFAIIILDYRSIGKSSIGSSLAIVWFLSLAGLLGKLPLQHRAVNLERGAKEKCCKRISFYTRSLVWLLFGTLPLIGL